MCCLHLVYGMIIHILYIRMSFPLVATAVSFILYPKGVYYVFVCPTMFSYFYYCRVLGGANICTVWVPCSIVYRDLLNSILHRIICLFSKEYYSSIIPFGYEPRAMQLTFLYSYWLTLLIQVGSKAMVFVSFFFFFLVTWQNNIAIRLTWMLGDSDGYFLL